MTLPADEEPDPEPDPEPEVEPDGAPPAASITPLVDGPPRRFEFRSERLTLDQTYDGHSLSEMLNRESEQGWDLVEVITGPDGALVLLRHPKRGDAHNRPVGFVVPSR